MGLDPFSGKNNIKLCVLRGYQPNPDSNDCPGTVFSQQERHLRSQNDDRDPPRAFIKDLEAQLDLWMTAGNLIIIGLDANDNVRTGPVNAMLQSRGLVEVHSAQHPHLAELPATKTLKPFPLTEYGHPHPLTACQQGTLDLAKSSLAKQITA
jgi:hypothetical protein